MSIFYSISSQMIAINVTHRAFKSGSPFIYSALIFGLQVKRKIDTLKSVK